MAATDALFTAGLVVSAPDARLGQSAAWPKNGLTPITGVVYAGNSTLLTATANTAPMQVSVSALHFVGSKADNQGVYVGANDGTYLLTIAAAPGSGSRTDKVYIQQQDSTAGTTSPDATTAAIIAATSGTLPAGAVQIGTVVVPAGVTKLTDVGVVVSTTCQWVAAAGAPIPVRNTTERDAMTPYLGMQVSRLDKGGLVQTHDGTKWRGQRTHGSSYTVSTDASGYATVTHLAGFTPTAVVVSGNNPTAQNNVLGTDTYTATTFRVRAVSGAGAPVSTSVVLTAVLYEALT